MRAVVLRRLGSRQTITERAHSQCYQYRSSALPESILFRQFAIGKETLEDGICYRSN